MENDLVMCPICRIDKAVRKPTIEVVKNATSEYDCHICGKFQIAYGARSILPKRPNPNLSAWTREGSEAGNPRLITSSTIEQIASGKPDYSVSKKQIKLMQRLEEKSQYPGFQVAITLRNDFPLAWANNYIELIYYLNSLIDLGLIIEARNGTNIQ